MKFHLKCVMCHKNVRVCVWLCAIVQNRFYRHSMKMVNYKCIVQQIDFYSACKLADIGFSLSLVRDENSCTQIRQVKFCHFVLN